MADAVELRKVEAYAATCPHCNWETSSTDPRATRWTIQMHLEQACPETGADKWSYEARSSA